MSQKCEGRRLSGNQRRPISTAYNGHTEHSTLRVCSTKPNQPNTIRRAHACDRWGCRSLAITIHVTALHGAQEHLCRRCFRASREREQFEAVRQQLESLFSIRPLDQKVREASSRNTMSVAEAKQPVFAKFAGHFEEGREARWTI